MEPVRKFKIIVNSKECGTCSGPTPSAVAKKVVKKLCGTSSKAVRFSLKECKRGCERVCGPYQGRMEKLDRPYKRGGKTITHRVVCGKVKKMRGGVLGQDGENLNMDDFKVQDESVPFLREYRDEKTKEQYIFFNPISLEENEGNEENEENEGNEENEENEENEGNEGNEENVLSQTHTENLSEKKLYYEYVVIRTKDIGFVVKKRSVYFKKLTNKTPNIIEPKNINLKILKRLLEEVNNKIINRAFAADTIQKELKKILTSRINELNNNQKNSLKVSNKNNTLDSDLINSFKVSNNSHSKIFVLEKGKRTSKLFGNKKQYIFFNKVNNSNSTFYQFVAIRHENQEITFKDSKLNEVSIEDIPEVILLQLLNDINEYRQTINNNNFATSIMKKLREYLHYNNKNLNKYFKPTTRNRWQNESDNFFYIEVIQKHKKYYIIFNPTHDGGYEYMIIIEGKSITFIKREINNSSHIYRIDFNDIPMDILFDLRTELSGMHLDNIEIMIPFLSKLNSHTEEYKKYKEWVESILKGQIKKTNSGNKITNLNGQNHNIKYSGKFVFDFLQYNPENHKINRNILEKWFKYILEKEKLIKGKNQNTYSFKPKITSIK